MRKACQKIAKFSRNVVQGVARDAAGNILPIAAMGVLVAVVVVGSAVDISRNYLARQQIQSACDSAVLAGRRTVTTAGFDQASKDAAKAYFAANFNDNTQSTRSTSFTVTSPDDGQTVTATATTILDTLLMRVFGKDNFPISVTCSSSMGVGNADVMMVLDTTGSMDSKLSGTQTRIQALREAMKNFYTTIYNATAASNARVRYGFVPFSSTVNVGRLLNGLDSRYIVDSYPYQSRIYEPDDSGDNDTNGVWNQNTPVKSYSSKSNCTPDLPADTAFTDSGSGATKVQTKKEYQCRQASDNKYYVYWRWITRPYMMRYRQITYDTSNFKKFNAVNTPTAAYGANESSTWGGCIQERGTVAQASFSYSSATGITPKAALDLDLDGYPDVNDNNTKWAPLWPDVSFRRWNSSGNYTTATTTYGGDGGSYCPVQARLLSTMTQTAFNNYADSLQAVGGTYLDIGMIWGGRMMSPQGMWQSLVNDDPQNGGEVSRHIIFMTDGQMEPSYQIPQAWGMEYWDRRVTSDGYSNDASRHTSRFLAVCEAIKDKGIRVWVIAFTSGLSSDLQTCASDDSSFTATSSGELNSAFQEIAKQVGELRVVQ
ncbi:pilus assembly protein TadG-related protein [Novosphingobium kaempferiae]|uniref:pilus assembly protein TadG-related protein n=1 Tax=Novosphingobium kaempferiae TaxID=2896849 RepID=UPI001E39C968|nr:pilus assembly protein TadG-related protein [Novosphingobium kaempferiae]